MTREETELNFYLNFFPTINNSLVENVISRDQETWKRISQKLVYILTWSDLYVFGT